MAFNLSLVKIYAKSNAIVGEWNELILQTKYSFNCMSY